MTQHAVSSLKVPLHIELLKLPDGYKAPSVCRIALFDFVAILISNYVLKLQALHCHSLHPRRNGTGAENAIDLPQVDFTRIPEHNVLATKV